MLALQVFFIYRFLSSSQSFFTIVQMKKLRLRKVQLPANDIEYSYPGLFDPQTSTFSHHPKIINLVAGWNYHNFCHYFVLGSTDAHWLAHMLMLWQASTFCVPGAILGPENLELASFYRLVSHWTCSRASYEQGAEAKRVSKRQKQTCMKTPSPCSGCHEEVVQGAMSGQNGWGRGLGAVIKVRVIPEEVPG